MKVLVTGGAGFIGSNFIRYWLKTHPEDLITNLDLLTYAGNFANVQELQNDPRYTFIHGSITDEPLVYSAMRNTDIVAHFAAETHVDNSITNPLLFFQTNCVGTAVLLEAARKNNVSHFHLVSTDEVFGQLELNTKEKFSEVTPYNPRNPYSASKAAADFAARAYFETYQLPITITNCSNNFGPYQHPEKLIPLTITQALKNQPIPVYGDGLNVRDWLYAADHCRAIDAVIHKGKAGETYLVGGLTTDISNLEVVRRILHIMHKPESLIQFVTDRKAHDRRYAIDWTKINTELNWQPRHNFDVWLEKTVLWYTEQYERASSTKPAGNAKGENSQA